MQSFPITTVAFMIFAAAFSALLGVTMLMESRRERRGWQARVLGSAAAEEKKEENTSGFQYLRDIAVRMLEKVGSSGQIQQKAPELSALRQLLITAGYRSDNAAAVFTGFKALFMFVLPGVVFMAPIPALDEASLVKRLLAYLLVAAAGLYGPELWLSHAVKQRKLKILHAFPDALDLLVVCVEAGLGLDAALGRTGKELALSHPELCEEFYMVALELRAGLPRTQALSNLAKRVDLDSVKTLVALLIQTDRFGTSVGQALRVHADSMRTDRALKAEEMAGKLPVKMLFPLMFFIFPSLFIVILGPAIIKGMRILMPALGG